MKKPSAKIREEIARLQDQLKLAETKEAERIGRVALRAGLGEIQIDEADLQVAFDEVASRFRRGELSTGERKGQAQSTKVQSRAATGNTGEG